MTRATGQVSRPGAARPVTPIGILALSLAELVQRIDDGALDGALGAAVTEVLGTDFAFRLRAAHALAGGLDRYVEQCTTPESAALRAVAARTAGHDWSAHASDAGRATLEQEMLSGHVEGQLLKMLVHATRARRVLDIGMFTGYSALALAEALPADGCVIACEIDPVAAEFARRQLADHDAARRVDVHVGPALDTLAQLSRRSEAFELVFVDADKPAYGDYVDAVLDGGLLAEHGLICVDNTLMQGLPWTNPAASVNASAITAFNRSVAADPRVEQVLLAVRDGVTLIRHAPR